MNTAGARGVGPIASENIRSVRVKKVASRVPPVGDVAKRITEFPGEDAPGTGYRNFPSVFDKEPGMSVQKHAMKSTKECYKEFATLSRSSCPLKITSKIPSGSDVMHTPDSGPTTGNRRMPKPFEGPRSPLVDPVDTLTPEERLRELQIRRCC